MSYKTYDKDNLHRFDGSQLHEQQHLLRGNSNGDSSHHPSLYHNKHFSAESRNLGLDNRDSDHDVITKPVTLTPNWESKNLSNDELNFHHLTLDETVIEKSPTDRYNFVYLILLLHGIGTLMPWNMFITAKSYFEDEKLSSEDELTKQYQSNFMLYITMAAQIPNLIFNFVNVFIRIGGSLSSRIVISVLIEILVFIFTVVLAMIDTASWSVIFFWLTIASVVVLNMANGIYQNSVYGVAGNLPMKYTNAVVLGSNISGTIVSLISIAAIAMAPNKRTSAIYYFITALFVLLACFDTYFALPLSRFYRYYDNQASRQNKSQLSKSYKIPYSMIFKKALPQLWNVFFTFFVTLSVFPSLHSDIKQTDVNFVIGGQYYTGVMCYLVFNFFSMIGNLIPFVCRIGPRWLWIPVLLRIFLLPAFLLSNYQPRGVTRVLPVLICSDWAHLGLGITLGMTGGYFASLAMMYTSKTVDQQYCPVAGMMAATSLILGIFSGVLFSFLMPIFVENIAFSVPDWMDCGVSVLINK